MVNRKGGKPRKELTGKRGRPAKIKSTKKAVEAAKLKRFGRKPRRQRKGQAIEWDSETNSPEEMDIDIG
jgi:hypothetical protein